MSQDKSIKNTNKKIEQTTTTTRAQTKQSPSQKPSSVQRKSLEDNKVSTKPSTPSPNPMPISLPLPVTLQNIPTTSSRISISLPKLHQEKPSVKPYNKTEPSPIQIDKPSKKIKSLSSWANSLADISIPGILQHPESAIKPTKTIHTENDALNALEDPGQIGSDHQTLTQIEQKLNSLVPKHFQEDLFDPEKDPEILKGYAFSKNLSTNVTRKNLQNLLEEKFSLESFSLEKDLFEPEIQIERDEKVTALLEASSIAIDPTLGPVSIHESNLQTPPLFPTVSTSIIKRPSKAKSKSSLLVLCVLGFTTVVLGGYFYYISLQKNHAVSQVFAKTTFKTQENVSPSKKEAIPQISKPLLQTPQLESFSVPPIPPPAEKGTDFFIGPTKPPKFIPLTITTDPVGAKVFLNKKRIGKTPLSKQIRYRNKEAKLRITKTGFEREEIAITPDKPYHTQITLTPKSKKRKRSRNKRK